MDRLLSDTQWFPVASLHSRRDRRPCEPPVRGNLGSLKRWGLAYITEVETGQLPLPMLCNKHQRGAHLRVHGIAPIGRFLGETANHDGRLGVGAHLDLVQGVSSVLHVTALMSREPLLPGQQEAQRPDPDEVVRQEILKESGITL